MEEELKTNGGFIDFFKESMNLKEVDTNVYSPLVLAYIGDGVYELIVRTKVINRGSMQVNKMHKKSAELVKAKTQAQLYTILEPSLTNEELTIYKRGRNAKSGSTAKNASVIDYRMATGFEALIGYLYLTQQYERMTMLISQGLAAIGEIE